jgi:hypothetical protein
MITEEQANTHAENRGFGRPGGPRSKTAAAPRGSGHQSPGLRGPLLAGACLLLLVAAPAWGAIRDGGVDPANLGKGGWIYRKKEVADPDSTFAAMKANGFNFVIVKAGRADLLWLDPGYVPVTDPNPVGVLLSSDLVQSAHRNGLFLFGSNRTGGDTNGWPITPTEITNEVKVADYVFNQGADGFIWDAEDTWENTNAGLGANGPTYAWWLASMVRAHWPTKFLGFNSWDTLGSHPSLPYKEFAYWSDCAMPMVYNHSGSTGNRSNVFATILWCDVNYRAWQDALRNSNSVMNGQRIFWTNAIKPLLLMHDVYKDTTCEQKVRDFLDYLVADPNCVTEGGYRGFDGFRSELFTPGQTEYMKAATVGTFPGIINHIVLDDARAAMAGSWLNQTTMSATLSAVSFKTGADTNSFGTNYFYKSQGNGAASMQFTPTILEPGDYDVFQWHPTRADASASVPHIISCTGGPTTVYADQTTNAGNWSLLGRFNFAAGTSGSIRVTDAIRESGRVAMVDGLKLVLAVPNPPHIDAIELQPSGEVRLQISGCPGNYSLEASTTLASWGELTNLTTTTHCFQITLPQPGQPTQFYRAKLTR